MRILLSNYNLSQLAGSQTWVQTIAKELSRLGHEVHLYASDGEYGLLPEYKTVEDNYDLALINHNTCLNELRDKNIKKRIFTSHGVIPDLEQPITGADLYVAVSEEVQANLKAKGFDSVVIRNPIDTSYFTDTPKSQKLSKVAYLSNYQGITTKVVQEASKAIVGLQVKCLGANNKYDAKEVMGWADLVIGLGRTAYEAMSMGRNVIVFDYNGADGFVTPETILEFRKNNCSGRRYKKDITVANFLEMLNQYDPNLSMREYIIENNDVRKITLDYLSLCNRVV